VHALGRDGVRLEHKGARARAEHQPVAPLVERQRGARDVWLDGRGAEREEADANLRARAERVG
jgi:hypothetical protein